MPTYTYRREDGTTFEIRQKFLDHPLAIDPETGQKVVRVVQAPGIIFKGSGFYVNDSKKASTTTINGKSSSNGESGEKSDSGGEKSASKTKAESTETKTEKKSAETKSSPKE